MREAEVEIGNSAIASIIEPMGVAQARNKDIGLPALPESSRKFKSGFSYHLAAPCFLVS